LKIPIDHVDLGELGYPEYWIEVPKSVKEGFLHDFAKMANAKPKVNGADGTDDIDDESARQTNIKIMELVTAWNIDDDAGKVLPVLSKVKTPAERDKVIAEIPVDIIVYVAQRIAGSVNVPEQTKDF